jgi:outer membrane murein-binding lipoprotein Lpp
MEMHPELPLTAKQLVAQRSNIVRKQLLSELEIEEIKQQVDYLLPTTEEHSAPEHQLETGDSHSAVRDQVYTNPDTLNERVKELRNKIISKQVASSCHNNRLSLRKLSKAIPNKLLEDINLALETINTTSITETNTLIYSTAIITLEKMGVKALPARHQASSPPWRIRLESNVKSLCAKISKLSHQMANSPKHPKRNATKEALESAKQRLVVLSARLKRYTKEQESKRVNRLFTHNPSRVYSMLKGEERKQWQIPLHPVLLSSGKTSGRTNQHITLKLIG